MPRRNSNALKARTRNRDRVPIRAIRTESGRVTYVPLLSTSTDNGMILVLLDGEPTYVPARRLIAV